MQVPKPESQISALCAAFLRLKELCEKGDISLKVAIVLELHDLVNYTFKHEHEIITDFLSSAGIEYLDIAPYFKDQESPEELWVAMDDAHLNKNGASHDCRVQFSVPVREEHREMSIFRKYKWYFIASFTLVAAFVAAVLWLYFATNVPQLGPFQYQVF